MNAELVYYRLNELKTLIEQHTEQDNKNFQALHEELRTVRDDVLTLKIKSGIWGAAAGTLAAAAISVLCSYVIPFLF